MKKILGLDIGVNSLGWGILEQNDQGNFCRIIKSGVRLFEGGVDLNEKTGVATSRTADRTQKRSLRRMTRRRRRRMSKIRHLLQEYNFLPGEDNFGTAVHEFDMQTIERLKKMGSCDVPSMDNLYHVLPYYLRCRALDYNLLPTEFGRAIYHLAQRRGFLSNRKIDKKDKDTGVVKKSISELDAKIKSANFRTLGEYFATLNPSKEKIRRLYTSRAMYIDEFNQICERQQNLLTEEMRHKLYDALFRQRPLKSVKKFVGDCRFEPGEKRCPWDCLQAQEYRYVDEVNNLRIIEPDRTIRSLSCAEKEILYGVLSGLTSGLDKNAELTYKQIKKILSLKAKSSFSIEEGGKKAIKGNIINYRLSNILGDKWIAGDRTFKGKILKTLRRATADNNLKEQLAKIDSLSNDEINALAEYNLPEGYCSVSLKAIRKLIPELKKGLTPIEVYPQKNKLQAALNQLPLVSDVFSIRNPAVVKVLSEIRKVVNALLLEYDRFDLIRIELARDLKSNEDQRKKHIQNNKDNEAKRRKCVEKIRKEINLEQPSRDDIEKVLLAEECNWTCPYTNRAICIESLLLDSEFDVEHIIPYSRCLDNSFANKTLCYHDENRNVKKNYTPYEVYSSDLDKYERILNNVANFNGASTMVAEKLRRFQLKSIETLDDFCSRQLNDTRYASKLAKEYLGVLYGGVVDSDGVLRVQASSGKVSFMVRGILEFNRILCDSNTKSRDDHRHHAVDAVAVALSDAKIIKAIADAYSDPEAGWKGQRLWQVCRNLRLFSDWPTYFGDIKQSIDEILPSHHVRNRLRGALHAETFYGKVYDEQRNIHHSRTSLESMSLNNVFAIVDGKIRETVLLRMLEIVAPEEYDTIKSIADRSVKEDEISRILTEVKANPKNIFKNIQNLPVMNNIVIRKAKISVSLDTTKLGDDEHNRQVVPSNNHHMVLVDWVDEDNKVSKTVGYVVTLLEASMRKKRGEPIVKRNYEDVVEKNRTYKQVYRMVLFKGDIIKTLESDGTEDYRIIRSIPQSTQIAYTDITDAREVKNIKELKKFYTAKPSTILDKIRGKFSVNYLGELRRNNA